ncbi:MAG: hypothetical protein K2Z81_28445 [Cyanobacteria bacterium]|nr:hypothetical protein [Cyanobacteriota bacterium]
MNEKDTDPSNAVSGTQGQNPSSAAGDARPADSSQANCASINEPANCNRLSANPVASHQPLEGDSEDLVGSVMPEGKNEADVVQPVGETAPEAEKREEAVQSKGEDVTSIQPGGDEIFGTAVLEDEDQGEIFGASHSTSADKEEIFGDVVDESTTEIVSGAQRIGIPIEEWEPDNAVTPGMVGEVERYIQGLFSKKSFDTASTVLNDLAKKGIEGFRVAMDLLGELVEKMSGVESFRVVPKPPMELEVEICSKKEQTFYLKQKVLPMVELVGVRFGKRVHFEAKVDSERKALRMTISEGITFIFNLGPLFGLQPVRIKGTGYLKRDDKGRLVMVTTVRVPGLDVDVDISVPLGLLFKGTPKQS